MPPQLNLNNAGAQYNGFMGQPSGTLVNPLGLSYSTLNSSSPPVSSSFMSTQPNTSTPYGKVYTPPPTTYNSQVLGASTGGASSSQPTSGGSSNVQQSSGPSYGPDMQSTIDAYNRIQSLMEGQKPELERAYNQGMSLADQQLAANEQAYNQNRSVLEAQNQLQQGQLGQSYADQVAQNRSIARAMGSFGSDYAQMQNRAGSGYQQNQMGLQTAYQGTLGNLMSQMNQARAMLAQQKMQLQQNYNDALRQVALSQGQTDLQKIQAINSIKQNYDYMQKMLGNLSGYTNPTGSNVVSGLGTTTSTGIGTMQGIPQTYAQSAYQMPGTQQKVSGGIDLRKLAAPSLQGITY